MNWGDFLRLLREQLLFFATDTDKHEFSKVVPATLFPEILFLFISTALAVLFTLVDSGIDVYTMYVVVVVVP